MKPLEDWQFVGRDEDVDTSGDAGLSADEAIAFETDHHLMNRRGSDAEMPLHVGFRWGLPEHARIDVDEGQVLALLFSEATRACSVRSA